MSISRTIDQKHEKKFSVPRNDHGNVDMFQECMLPIGCVWINDLDTNTVAKVCRKLNIDYAKPIVGFQPKKGFPMYEGVVVCEEFKVKIILILN